MISKTLPALLAACAFLSMISLAAGAEPALAIVTGLAPGDLLNVRADASPVGHTRTRLANGASVRNSGCADFSGYLWCKIAVVDQPGVDGWVPERYLLAVDPEEATPTLDEAEIRAGTHVASATAPTEQGGGETTAAAAPALPPNLAARLGDTAPAAGGDQKSGAPATLTPAETEAYRVAYAARMKAEAEARKAAGGTGAGSDATPVAGGEGETVAPGQADVAAGVPVPTPRPDPKGGDAAGQMAGTDATPVGTPQAEVVARADPRSSWDATGEIPCARYVGQPMTQCRVGIKREGSGRADITVTWPDGGTRIIGFHDGRPAGADSDGEFRFTREGDLNMIRVGVSERFEITDTQVFGN